MKTLSVEDFISYLNYIKPYRTKLTNLVMSYIKRERITVETRETLHIDIFQYFDNNPNGYGKPVFEQGIGYDATTYDIEYDSPENGYTVLPYDWPADTIESPESMAQVLLVEVLTWEDLPI